MSIDVTPTSIIYGLPRGEWRGEIMPPYDVAGFDFSHRQAEIQFWGVDGAMHQWGGMNTTPMPFRFYFLNTLYENAFPDNWETWQKLLFDGRPGPLRHPLRGPVDAVVLNGKVDLKATATAGIIVDVTFTSTILNPNKSIAYTLDVSVPEVAAAARAAAEVAPFKFPYGQSKQDLLAIIDEIHSLIYATDVAIQGTINTWQSKLGPYIALAEGQFPGTEYFAVYDLFVTLWGAVEDKKDKILQNLARTTAWSVASNQTTLDAIARERGNSVQDIMALNSSLLGSSYVPKGTAYLYYKD